MEVIKTIIHDLTGYKRETVDVARGDRGSRVVRCRLTAAGSPWKPPDGCRVQVAYELPDGTPGLYEKLADGTAAGKIDGNTVELRIAEALTRLTGVAEISGVLIGPNGAQVATWPMRLNVVGPNVLSDPEQWPQLGAEFEGMMVFISGGVVTPLKLGPGLSIRDGMLYVSGGGGYVASEEPPEDTNVLWVDTSEPDAAVALGVTAVETDEGVDMYCTDELGTTKVTVRHGKDGAQGPAGPQGAPGEDYVLTDDDVQEIAGAVLAVLPTWTGGAY